MRPVIPRVRVGDVLKGTRNLRHWLQTAATLNYLNNLRHNYGDSNKAKECIYTPSKNDEFLVTVNAWGVFGVYSVNKDVVLLFINRSKEYHKRMHRPLLMDPTIFSKWFIRTPRKCPDLETWPLFPYYMRACLHLNVSSMKHEMNTPQMQIMNGPEGPFQMHSNQVGGWEKASLKAFVQASTPKGITRPGAWNWISAYMGHGPRMEDLEPMRGEIMRLCSNPRLLQKIKSDKELYYGEFQKTYLTTNN